jgi:demethylmenaquinone methyltransferase/2-methoxy-6-polyprenyl-1,4-benzoquinol methylase
LVFIDNAYVEGSSTPISTTDSDGNTYQSRTLEDGSTHVVLKNFPTEAQIRQTINDIGSNVEVEFLKYYWTLAYVPQSGS